VTTSTNDLEQITLRLRQAGCVAAEEEAAELIEATAGKPKLLESHIERRCKGEPLAWLVGSVTFCDENILVHPGVYVPRWQSEPMVREGLRRLPERGTAVDLCAGSGAIAVILARGRPRATVLATETDQVAIACARANGVTVYEGDMAKGLPKNLFGTVDVVIAVVPYVPTEDLHLLPRDVTEYEPLHALDGGTRGMHLLIRAAQDAARLLKPGGSLLLELGGDQADDLQPPLTTLGFTDIECMTDEDGDLRALVCRRPD
jgi:release factor glutamine methyltransferase